MHKDAAELTTKPRMAALGIAMCYIVIGSIYIVVSDFLVYQPLVGSYRRLLLFQSGKGIAFVVLTGLALYGIMLLYLRKVNALLQDQLQRDIALHTALERFPGPSAIFDDQCRLEFINDSSLRLLGLQGLDIVGKPASDIFVADKTGDYFDYLLAAYDTAEPRGGEVVIKYKKRERYFMMTFVPVNGVNGKVKRVIALAYDVSDRKLSAIRMEQQKRELRQIIDLIPNFVFAKDDKGRYILANLAFCQFHGMGPEQIIGKTAAMILPDPTIEPEIIKQDLEVMSYGRMVFRPNQVMKDSEGRHRTFQLTKIPFRTATGNRSALLGIALDISEQLENEKAITKSQNRFRALVDHSLDALFVYDATGELTLVNEQACSLLGRSRYELLGKNFMEALVGNTQHLYGEGGLPIFYAGTCFQLVLESKKRGGSIPVEVRIGPLPGDDEGVFLAEVRDISERLQVEQERQFISRLGINLSATRNEGEIAHTLFDSIREVVPLDSFFFAIRISGKYRYRMNLMVDTISGIKNYYPGYSFQVRADSPLLPVYNGNNLLILRNDDEDNDDSASFSNFGDRTQKSRSLMYFSIVTADKVVAILSVQSYQVNAYSEETVEKIQRLASMAGPALESAHAHQQKSLFAELGRQLGAARTAEDVAEVVAHLADDLTGWDSCIIGLYSRDDDNITYIYLADEIDGKRQRIYEPNPFRKPRLLAERVLKEGPFLVLRQRLDPADTHFPSAKGKPPALSMIWVPIPGDDGPTGFISLQSYAHEAYDEEDLQTTRALADHCGAALNRTGSQELLRYREERYRKAIEATGAVTYQLDYIHNEYVFMGRQIEDITGYAPEEFSESLWEKIILEVELDPQCDVTYDEFGRKNFKQWKTQIRIMHRNGDERWLSDQAVQMHNSTGVAIGTLGIIRDITEQKRIELALRASEERYALSARGANDGLWDWDLENNHIHFSERWVQMLGYTESEPFSTPEQWYSRVHPDDVMLMQRTLREHLLGVTQHFECETRTLHRNGNYRWMLIRGIAVRDQNDKPTRIAGSQTDVTDRVLTQERLLHDSLHDPLTGLPNRSLLMEHLNQCLYRIKSDAHYRFAVVFMDLDRFKTINDSLGHLVGDHVLVTVANRLKATIRPTDFVARFAGDEFALVLEQYNNDTEIVDVVARVQLVVSQAITIENHEITTSASAGVAVGSVEYSNPNDLLRDADNALYKSKSDGPGHFRIFDNSMHDHAIQMIRLEADLRRAIDRNEMKIYYQPIINIDDGKVLRFEALIRWEHPELGLLAPDRFMDLAEETGLIFGLDEWVLKESCRCLKRWNDELGLEMEDSPIRINVNLSPRHFLRPIDFTERLKSIIDAEGVKPEKFGLEITENALLSFQAETTLALTSLKNEGFSLYLDDFGKGYSSLSYLHNFPFDVVKIDRLFMMRIQSDGPEREIVFSILSLASKLKLGVVAEGIETVQQLEIVKQLGCSCVQGFFISEAVKPEDALMFLVNPQVW